MPGVTRTITGEEALGGGFYCVGFTPDPAARAGRALLVKTDEEGRLEWQKSFFASAAGESMAYSVRATGDGGCVFAGHATTEGSNVDLALVRVPPGEG